MPAIEAVVEFPNGRAFTFNDVLRRLTHHRGFDQTSSYCIIETEHAEIDIMTEFMNFSKFKIRYGRDDRFIPDTLMEVFSIENEVQSPNVVKCKLVGFEPGFVRLKESDKIRSFPNTTVSEVVKQLCGEAGLKTTRIIPTTGTYTYIQPNVSDLEFIEKYLLPIATDGAGTAPFLFTIDTGNAYLKPPSLKGDPIKKFILDPTKDNTIKHVTFRNSGAKTDLAFGNRYLTYSYNFREKGLLEREETMETIADTRLNNKLYNSNFFKTEVLPYEEEWMLKAHNRNNLGRGQFVIAVDAVIEGSPFYDFDASLQIDIPLQFEQTKGEYSGFYYIYHMAAVLTPKSFNTHVSLRSNSFLRHERLEASNATFGSQVTGTQQQVTRGSVTGVGNSLDEIIASEQE